MNWKRETQYHGFLLQEEQALPDIHGTGYLFVHEQSGARLFYVDTADDNKVFFAAFKTPPADHCGTAHILEHSVLCGSKKYRVKDPFNELAKGSLNTYLNAMTFGDKTMYPVASRNEKDFRNLMDVYLDAVFNPLIYERKEIFMQEGWHDALETPDGDLERNGVVYSEMKGALSNPERLLMDAINESLFPTSPYRFESGGDPQHIPELTYEAFLDFHRKYYHPSNCFLYLYGNMDILSCMEHLHTEYLAHYTRAGEAVLNRETAFRGPVRKQDTYPAAEQSENGVYLSYNVVAGACTDPTLTLSLEVLGYLLFESNASPLKKALLDAGIGDDVECWFDSSTLDMVFSVVVKNAKPGQEAAFETVLRNTLEDLAEKGLDKDLIAAALSVYSFYLREEDYGYRPKGLVYGIKLMKRFLHGETPFESLKHWSHFAQLEQGLTTPYFETLMRRVLFENPHRSLVALLPEPGKQSRQQAELEAALARKKDAMTSAEKAALTEETAALKAYQNQPETPEDLAAIPSLELSDVSRRAETIPLETEDGVLRTPLQTNGIVYVKLLFPAGSVPQEALASIGLVKELLANLDTASYSRRELAVALDRTFGDVSFSLEAYPTESGYLPALVVDAKFLAENKGPAFALLTEVLTETLFSKQEDVLRRMKEVELRLAQALQDNGHMAGARRAMAHFSEASAWKDRVGGIEFCRFLKEAQAMDFDTLRKELEKTAQALIHGGMFAHVAAETDFCEAEIDALQRALIGKPAQARSDAGANSPAGNARAINAPVADSPVTYDPAAKNLSVNYPAREGLTTAGKVQYVAQAADYRAAGYSYRGTLRVAESLLDRAYLWNQVRVLGGAYGSGVQFQQSGQMYFYSYRDPNIQKTLEAYARAADFLEGLSLSKGDLTKYILGAVNKQDRPRTNAEKADLALRRYLAGITPEAKQRERAEILDTTEADLRALGEMLRRCTAQGQICVIGNGDAIAAQKEVFDKIEGLL